MTINQAIEEVKIAMERVEQVHETSNNCVHRANEAMGLAHSANGTSIKAFERAKEALKQAEQAAQAVPAMHELHAQVSQQAQAAAKNLRQEFNRLRQTFEGIQAAAVQQQQENLAQVELTKIQEKNRLGIFEQQEQIRAQAVLDAEKIRWESFEKIISNPKTMIKIVLTITAIAVGIYGARYAIKMLSHYLMLPRVVSETSQTSLFGLSKYKQTEELQELIFEPSLHKQLFDLSLRVKAAKEFNESLPNVLFYGVSGTGKTAFAKALARWSGLDYALTSGSEFAKITDLNVANNELRRLINWAKNSRSGLIVFIDEAESLFADRKLPTTPKTAQDFINTFLDLVSDQSQKNLMFIFATNLPFKIDDAIMNRIGMIVEFTLPEREERIKIFLEYLEKFAHEIENAQVSVDPGVMPLLTSYAESLQGFSPREIKFIVQEMVIYARQQANRLLTCEIAQEACNAAQQRLEKTRQWKQERDEWTRATSSSVA